MTGITGEITGNNWIFKNLQVWKRVQKIPWLISVIEIWGCMTGIIGKMMEKSTCELKLKASYYNYLYDVILYKQYFTPARITEEERLCKITEPAGMNSPVASIMNFWLSQAITPLGIFLGFIIMSREFGAITTLRSSPRIIQAHAVQRADNFLAFENRCFWLE